MWEKRRYRGKFAAVRYIDGKRERRSLGTSDNREADRAIRRLNSIRPTEPTVQWIWDEYTHENQGKAVIETMGHTWKALGPTFGHLEPHTIGVDLCRAYTSERRAKGRGDGTIHTELGHLRTVLLWGVKREHIPTAPHIERPPKPAPKEHYLKREEAAALIDGASAFHIRLAIILLLATAGRVQAILDLTWDRVDFERGLIHLRDPDDTTRRKGRATVPMNRMARSALEHARRASLSDYVIEWAGKKVGSIKKGLATAAKNAGLKGVSAHVLRHSAAVWMAEANRPMTEIAQMLGHADSRVTERVYAKFSPDYLRTSADVLDLDLVQLNQRELRG